MAGRVLVTVDGLDGSGKSSLAQRLAGACAPPAVVLAVDDFRRPVDWSRRDRSTLDLYYHERYDLAALDACVARFLAGASECRFPGFDGLREALVDERVVRFAGAQALIVEGVFVARLPSAAQALTVYLDIPHDEARRRVLDRDVKKQRTPEEVQQRIDTRYFPAHERYQAECRPRDGAVVLIDGRVLGAPRLLRCGPATQPAWAPVLEILRAQVAG